MNIKNDQKYYSFCLSILNAFHLDSFVFFKNLANDYEYETLFFHWINELYIRDISVIESIRFIHRIRYSLTFYNTELKFPKKKLDLKKKTLPIILKFNKSSIIEINL